MRFHSTHFRRRGLSLAEALAVMFAGSIVFGIATMLLNFTFAQGRSGKDSAEAMTRLDHLAVQFRADVHAARDVVLDKSAPQSHWSLRLSKDRRIEYSLHDGMLSRTALDGDRVQARDGFPLPEDFSARVELRPQDKPSEASLVVSRRTEPEQEPPGADALRIAAQIGRDRRFLAEQK